MGFELIKFWVVEIILSLKLKINFRVLIFRIAGCLGFMIEEGCWVLLDVVGCFVVVD